MIGASGVTRSLSQGNLFESSGDAHNMVRFELTAQFLDSEAQALAELLGLLSKEQLRQLFPGGSPHFRMARLSDALRALRVALLEAGFASSS